jgi:hypothetical protein
VVGGDALHKLNVWLYQHEMQVVARPTTRKPTIPSHWPLLPVVSHWLLRTSLALLLRSKTTPFSGSFQRMVGLSFPAMR